MFRLTIKNLDLEVTCLHLPIITYWPRAIKSTEREGGRDEKVSLTNIPDLDEDVQPVEDDVGNLRSEAKKLKKVGSISKSLAGIFLAKFVDNKILWNIINE
jgi:hypothetical protein